MWLSREAETGQKWGRAFVHESGHAVMAVLQEISCSGIYYNLTEDKFCNVPDLPDADAYTRRDYLYLTAGTAAENLIYGDPGDGANLDKECYFENPAAPSWEKTFNESEQILSASLGQLKSVVARLHATLNKAKGRIAFLPQIGMDGTDTKFAVLMDGEELEDIVKN